MSSLIKHFICPTAKLGCLVVMKGLWGWCPGIPVLRAVDTTFVPSAAQYMLYVCVCTVYVTYVYLSLKLLKITCICTLYIGICYYMSNFFLSTDCITEIPHPYACINMHLYAFDWFSHILSLSLVSTVFFPCKARSFGKWNAHMHPRFQSSSMILQLSRNGFYIDIMVCMGMYGVLHCVVDT